MLVVLFELLANVDIVQMPLVVHSLLPYENKVKHVMLLSLHLSLQQMSVVNFCLKRSLHYTQPIKSKVMIVYADHTYQTHPTGSLDIPLWCSSILIMSNILSTHSKRQAQSEGNFFLSQWFLSKIVITVLFCSQFERFLPSKGVSVASVLREYWT